MKSLNNFKGCLIGGAVGDALGYPIEFYNIEQIKNIYGEDGITEFELNNGKAIISDDTQMTLFTANGILIGKTRAMMRGIAGSCETYIYQAYLDWLDTQRNTKKGIGCTWISRIKELNVQRSPGNTCIGALSSGKMGTIERPINNSKGCGGIMRVAPIGLYFSRRSVDEIGKIGAKTNAITHGHPLGNISSYVMTVLINTIIYGEYEYFEVPYKRNLEECIEFALAVYTHKFRIYDKKISLDFVELIHKAINLTKQNIDDIKAIEQLGEGWVAEEALAIAIYCSVKYSINFEKAIIASVNHSGDSDSTGAITGNILGAYLGISNIPNKFLEKLELRTVIEEIAEDLYNDCPVSEYADNSSQEAKRWLEKY